MSYVFIGPYEIGIQRDLDPYLLPNEAFTDIEDAYVFRGRIVRKKGYSFLGRLHETPTLPEALPNVNTGAVTYTATLANPPISPGTVTIVIGTVPAMTFTDNGNGSLTSPTVTANFGVIDYESGTFTLSFTPVLPGGGPFAVNATAYRTLLRAPCMGLATFENINLNQEDLIAFDVDHSYLFNTATGIFDELTAGSWGANNQWTASNSDLIWTCNYYVDATGAKLLWATDNIAYNANLQDGIQYFNNTTWVTLQAQINATPTYLRGGLIVLPYRDRLVVLNTLEGPVPAGGTAIRYPNRVRWSQNGTPLFVSDANAWREDVIGRGGYIDAPTGEQIVSAEFYKDTLVVFFERSTWRLKYTGNELLPFFWERINAEFGAESTFSPIIFDDGILAVGDKRIINATSLGVTPIDQKIPDEVYNFHNDNLGPKRVYGIRHTYTKLVYWTFPNDDANEIYPNRILVLNYEEGAYSFFNDSFTCFGFWQPRVDYTWGTLDVMWSEWDRAWGDPATQSEFPFVIGGNQLGFVEKLNTSTYNEQSLDLINTIPVPSISNTAPAVFDCPNHNLHVGQFIQFYWTQAFGIAVVNEAVGTALAATTSFSGTLANIGLFPATLTIVIGANTFTDLGNGTLAGGTGGSTIDYVSGIFTVNYGALGADTPVTASYTYNIINYRTFKIVSKVTNTFTIADISATGVEIPINFDTFGAPYTGTGEIRIVNNFLLQTKRFSPFIEQGQITRLKFIEMLLKTADGTFTTQMLLEDDPRQPATIFNVSSSNETGITFAKEKNWKRVYTNSSSDFIQMLFEMSDYQMTQRDNYSSEFELHGMVLNIEQSGRL
jgi:hypothetical protein